MPEDDSLISLNLPCDPRAPKVVRDALVAAHDGCWSLDDGLLIASELVTNAVQHSGSTAAGRLRVDIGRRPGHLVISVHDPGLSGAAADPVRCERARSGRSEPGGWGLALVERLALRWGAERPDGYRVWAELPAYA